LALRAGGAEGAAAQERLHELLLHAARFEVSRRAPAIPCASRDSLDDLAVKAAGGALTAVLAQLDTWRGTSRFTTWARKFALLEAGVALRRLAWQHREAALDGESRAALGELSPSAESQAQQSQTLAVLFAGIAEDLTPHERQVVVALAIDGVPIDVLAERLATTRGELYATLHGARLKLRACLADAA
jgi:RNA polymerase sigma-70 factor, ECF subfamily